MNLSLMSTVLQHTLGSVLAVEHGPAATLPNHVKKTLVLNGAGILLSAAAHGLQAGFGQGGETNKKALGGVVNEILGGFVEQTLQVLQGASQPQAEQQSSQIPGSNSASESDTAALIQAEQRRQTERQQVPNVSVTVK